MKQQKQRDTALLWGGFIYGALSFNWFSKYMDKSKGTLHVCGGALFIGRFRSTGFLNSWKSRPEFEKQVPN